MKNAGVNAIDNHIHDADVMSAAHRQQPVVLLIQVLEQQEKDIVCCYGVYTCTGQ